MVEKKIKFVTSGQLMSFCKICQKMKSDIDVADMSNRNFIIDGKSLLGLMSIKLGLPMRLIVNGEDEELAHQYFTNYEFEGAVK
ncbi:PTS HPr component phosphorylation site [Lachnoclostridium sp. An169]|uniref:HPr family phosphocarrier protein n=1 Tax=Lachnoclostridium sp. An169 TaxID=1965569 RepID=UPI000B395C0C|nr:HPr family phosphocarrier protein [Lachnoclostridium sp. An169]OUP82459.1 PTS HPr component phosphorylation site [Lachnoclostridium sp. An169]HJA67014.1 HPr family phosphocarrier protein [Candidatus Mediterraneibacter cottocaccae]